MNTSRSPKRSTLIIIAVGLAMIGQFATEIYLPSLPSIAVYFNTMISTVQLTVAFYLVGFSIGNLVSGAFSDRFGRRIIVIISMIIGVIGCIICCFPKTINSMYIGRCIQGIGLGGVSVMCRSICRDIATDAFDLSKLASILAMVSSSAVASAPIVGGYIQMHFFWQANFLLLLIISIALLLLSWYFLPETNKNLSPIKLIPSIKNHSQIFFDREFLLFNLLGTITFGAVIAYQTISAKLLQLYVGLNPQQFGFTALIVAFCFILGGLLNSKLVARRGFKNMFNLGFKLYIISGAVYIVCSMLGVINIYTVLLPLASFIVGASLVYPNASTGSMNIYGPLAGTAASIYSCLQTVGGAIGSALMSLNANASQLDLGVVFAATGLLGLYIVKKIDFLK